MALAFLLIIFEMFRLEQHPGPTGPFHLRSQFSLWKQFVYLVGQKTWLYDPVSQSTGLLLLAFSMLYRRAKPAERQRKVATAWEVDRCDTNWCAAVLLGAAGGVWGTLVHYLSACLLQCPCWRANNKALVSMMSFFLGVWGSILFLLQLLVSLSASLCTYWLDFGLFKASLWINTTQQSMDQAYPRRTLPPSPSLHCVSLGIKLLLSGKVSLVLNYPSDGVCNITNCHTGLTNVLEHIISDTPDKFRSALTREAENCILLVKYQILWHGRGFFWSLFVVFVSLWHYYRVCSSFVWTVLYSKSRQLLHKHINCFYSLNCTFSIA